MEKVILAIKDNIYNISLRMLWKPIDAEDVTQEILIKVLTNLAKFRGESKFTTWVYRIATNHLLMCKKRGLENQELSFDLFEKGIQEGFMTNQPVCVPEVDRDILAEELKISCTHAMLLCLEREQRMIYILSSIFGINSIEGADILSITPETYRKRLSRIREKMRCFMENNCGLLNPEKSCRCNKRIEVAIENYRINPEKLLFAQNPLINRKIVEICRDEMEEFDEAAAIFARNPHYLAPETIVKNLTDMINSGEYKLMQI